jgi:tetratricopeptide (TPR) repeat protein
MKAEHRHELKTNELVEWLTNLPQWANENLTTIIGVVVVLAVAGGLYIWKVYTKNVVAIQKQLQFTNLASQVIHDKMQIVGAQDEGKDISFILLQPAENLKNLAQSTSTSQMAALALIKRAEALRAELHYRLGPAGAQEFETAIEQAKNSYAQAIEKAPSNPSLVAAAKFGLGLCEEELGDFEKAAQIYRDVAENPDYQATVASAAAKFRLETMADYKQKLVFKPAPKPVVPLESLIEKLPIDINLPVDVNQRPQSPNNVSILTDVNTPAR